MSLHFLLLLMFYLNVIESVESKICFIEIYNNNNHSECTVPMEDPDDPLIIDFDHQTCNMVEQNNITQCNVGCKISFRCRDENRKKEFILSENGKTAFCMEDGTWGEQYWPTCESGNAL